VDGTAAATPDQAEADGVAMPAGGPWSAPYRRLTAGLLLTIVGVAFEALSVATVLPETVADLGGLGLYGWVFSAFMLTNLVGLAIAGGEADRRGPVLPFALGVILFGAGLVIAGVAASMTMLIAGRAVQGIGGGFLGSVIYVVIGRGYPSSARPRMLALASSAWVVPGLIGPALAGLIADHIGWRWVFLGLIPGLLLAAAMVLPALRGIPAGNDATLDRRRIARAVQLAFGTGLVLGALSAPPAPIAALLALVGVVVSYPALRALLPAGTARAAPGLPAAVATMGLLSLAFFGIEAFMPLGLNEIRNRSPSFSGLILTAATITWTTGSWLLDRYARRTSKRVLIRIGLWLIALGGALITVVLATSIPAAAAIGAWGIAGLGMGLAYSTLTLVVLERAPAGAEGTASASMQLANVLGIAIGTGIGGALVAAFSSADDPSRTSLVSQNTLMIAALLLAIVIAGRVGTSE
jgi:MFS family permease